MISGVFTTFFSLLAIAMGLIFVWFGWSEKTWLPSALGLAFIIYGGFLFRGALQWLRMRPAESLRLYPDYFCIGSKRHSYLEFQHVDVECIRTKKRLNFMPAGLDETVFARLHLANQLITLRAGSGPTTLFGPSIGKHECEKFLRTLDLLKWRAAESQGGEKMDYRDSRQ